MDLNYPSIKEFGYIHRAFLLSRDEPALNDAWQTIIFCVPVGHSDLPLLHQAAKLRQTELREQAAKEKAKSDKEKNNPLITRDESRDENNRNYRRK
jgi:hypothetical protein